MDPGKGHLKDAFKVQRLESRSRFKTPSLYAAMGIQRHTITVSFTHSFGKHLQSACYDTNCNQEARFLLGGDPEQVRPTRWQQCSRRDQGDRGGEQGFQTQWPWTEVSKNVGDRCELGGTTPRVTSLSVLVYTPSFYYSEDAFLYFSAVVYKTIPSGHHPTPPRLPGPLWLLPLRRPAGFLPALVLPGNHPGPSAPCLASLCPLSLTQCSWQPLAPNHRPGLQAAGPPAAWPRLRSSTSVPIACLLTAPGICSKPSHLPPETPAVWLPGSLPLHPSARQPFQTHFLVTKSVPQESDVTSHRKGNPALWGGAAPSLPTKGVGKPPSPWQLTSALCCLPTLLFRGTYPPPRLSRAWLTPSHSRQ